MKKTTQFKELLNSDHLEFLMEAHNGLSAGIVEEAGFKGIWGSGLTISASEAVRDSNEMSWTQVLDIVEYMSDATTIPIMLDADTGYGNFNNMRRLVRKLEQRNVAAACIEDKIFPKCNSLVSKTYSHCFPGCPTRLALSAQGRSNARIPRAAEGGLPEPGEKTGSFCAGRCHPAAGQSAC